jgi:hypothetical protein
VEDNIKIDWIGLAKGRNRRRAFVNTIMDFLVP